MLEGFDSFYNDVSYDEVTKTHNMHAIMSTCSKGGKIVHIFEIPYPNLPIHFVTFRALRRRLGHIIGEK